MKTSKIVLAIIILIGFISGVASAADISTSKMVYAPNEQIVVNFSNGPGNQKDWIGLYVSGSDDANYINWLYVDGTQSGNTGLTDGTVVFAGLPNAGNFYEVRFFQNNGYSYLAHDNFSVQGSSAVDITTSKSTYNVGESIVVNWSNGPGNSKDWIALSPQGSSSSNYVDWTYIGGAAAGSHTFSGLAAGDYEARFYENDGYTISASNTFSVQGDITLRTLKTTYSANESIVIYWDNAPGNYYDWIGLSPQGSSIYDYMAFEYTYGATSGSQPFNSGLPPGDYEARFYEDDGWTILATVPFVVEGDGTPEITSPTPGSTLSSDTVTFYWTDTAAFYWLYVGTSQGSNDIDSSGYVISSHTVSGLPTDGSTIYVTLWYSYDGWNWDHKDYQYTAATITTGGFQSEFNGDSTGWYWYASGGSWAIHSDYWYYTEGAPSKMATTYYGWLTDFDTSYDDFEYEARFWRNGCDSCASGIMFRGNPSPEGTWNYWKSGYGFFYRRDGKLGIFKFTDGSLERLYDWTDTSLLNKGSAWNTLKVYATGGLMYFYINDTYVTNLYDNTYSSGKAGLIMSSDSNNNNALWVDWARLTPH